MNAHEHYLAISDPSVGVPFAGFVRLADFGGGGLVLGSIENKGDANFTVTINDSDNNNSGDAWAARTVVVRNGAGTTTSSTITVVPGGQANFVLIDDVTLGKYIRFQTGAPGAIGLIGLTTFRGDLITVLRDGVLQ